MILFRRRGEVRGRRLVMVNFALLAGHEIILCGLRFRLDYLFWVSFVCPRLLQVCASRCGFVLGSWLDHGLLALVVIDWVSLRFEPK